MNKKGIEKKLYEIISEILDVDIKDICLNSDIEEDFHANSSDAVKIVTRIENEFNIDVGGEALAGWDRIEDIINYISTKIDLESESKLENINHNMFSKILVSRFEIMEL